MGVVAPIKMFSGGMPATLARTLLPSNEGKPRKPADTIATRVAPSCRTRARTFKSPSLRVTGCEGPTPPETGNKGSGVTTLMAIAARKSAPKAEAAKTPTATRAKTRRQLADCVFCFLISQRLARLLMALLRFVVFGNWNHFGGWALCGIERSDDPGGQVIDVPGEQDIAGQGISLVGIEDQVETSFRPGASGYHDLFHNSLLVRAAWSCSSASRWP